MLICKLGFALAQVTNYKVDSYTSDDGLSHNNVSCIAQDSTGFIWLGTHKGLNRFEGFGFKTYLNDPKDSNSLVSVHIECLLFDKKGNLWIGTIFGLDEFIKKDERFLHISQAANCPVLKGADIKALLEDKNGNIWIGTYGRGLFKINPVTLKISAYIHDRNQQNSISNDYVNALYQDNQNKLWIGTESGLNCMDIMDESIKHYSGVDGSTVPEGTTIMSISRDKNDNLLICTWSNGLCIFNRKTDRIEKFSGLREINPLVDNTAVINALIDEDGSYWISTFYNGIVVVNPHNNSITNFRNENQDSYFIKCNTTWSLFEDKSGIKWIGTFGGGLVKIVKNNNDFLNAKNIILEKGGKHRSNSNITSICQTRNHKILIGTAGGEINTYSPISNVFEAYIDNNTLSTKIINTIIEDKEDKLWIGTDKGVEIYIPGTKKHSEFIPSQLVINQTGLPKQASIQCICIDTFGWVWLGSFDEGLFKYNPATGVCKQYVNNENDPESISNNVIWSVCTDHNNNVWIGTRNLLNRYNRSGDNFVRYTPDAGNPRSISHNVISYICEDSKMNVWIATLGNGINKYDSKKDEFTWINETNGLSDNSIFGIAEDSKGSLWLSSAKGLSKYNPVTGTVENFDKSNGFRDNLFNMGVCSKSHEGIVYFGGVNGLNVVNPDSIKDFTETPPIVLTDFKRYNKSVVSGKYIDGRLILPREINELKEINLKYNDYVISLEFSILDYAYPKTNHYAYILEGFDKEWVFTDASRRFATYTNLSPGKYTFKVKATNHCGIWNNSYKSLNIIISPPFWDTAWFRTFVILAFVLSVILFIRFRIRYYRKQKNILKELVIKKTGEIADQYKILEFKNEELSTQKEEILEMTNKLREADEKKMKFFTNISHELRTPLTLILGPADNLMKNNTLPPNIHKEITPIYRNASRLLHLINELLDFQKMDNDTMKLKVVESDLVKFISEIVYAFDNYAAQQHIDLYYIPEFQEFKTIFDPDKIEIILYNLLSNAFKFTLEGGRIKVSLLIQESTQTYQIIVQDNGIGIDKGKINTIFNRYDQIESGAASFHGSGIGLAMTKEIIEFLGGKIIVSSMLENGTVFTITLPILNHETLKRDKISILQEIDLKRNEQLITEFIPENAISLTQQLPDSESNAPKILVIDDNTDLRLYIKECLTNKYKFYEASNGNEGLLLAQNKLPQLIISDIMMPGIDGIKLCQQLKSDITTSHIPIILLTGKVSSEIQAESYKTGADDYLTKPFKEEVLVARVQNLIESREKLRKTFISKIDFKPQEITLTTTDERFLNKAFEIVEKNLGVAEFGPSELVSEIGLSRTMVFYKLKELTGSNASEFIKNIRLKRAYQMLKQNQYRVSDVCYNVGFADPNYFSKSFKKLYGVSPAKFAENPF
jgi:signal transduction histidine kinase/ligand-binding sensor domain-containing protein/CheY-like chemotaxis protein